MVYPSSNSSSLVYMALTVVFLLMAVELSVAQLPIYQVLANAASKDDSVSSVKFGKCGENPVKKMIVNLLKQKYPLEKLDYDNKDATPLFFKHLDALFPGSSVRLYRHYKNYLSCIFILDNEYI